MMICSRALPVWTTCGLLNSHVPHAVIGKRGRRIGCKVGTEHIVGTEQTKKGAAGVKSGRLGVWIGGGLLQYMDSAQTGIQRGDQLTQA